jgi:hypothetical protein
MLRRFTKHNCTLWEELKDSIKFHAELAYAGRIPTEFIFLNHNDGAPLAIGDAGNDATPAAIFAELEKVKLDGHAPLCKRIRQVVDGIASIERDLREADPRQTVSIVIATHLGAVDTDGCVIRSALEELAARGLSVTVVARLLTNDEMVKDTWSLVDRTLKYLSIDVLDDLEGEAKEVEGHNSWLKYGEPLHRLRELGLKRDDMDALDERLLEESEMRSLVADL